MNPTQRSLLVILLTSAGLGSAPAAAQSHENNFWFEGQAYFPKVDSSVMVSSITDNTIGTDIDFEKDLDLDDRQTLPSFSAGARIGKSFRVVLEYYSLGRKASTTLNRNLVFDDVTYPVAGTVQSRFDTDVYRFSIGWSFARKENYEFGAALGFHGTEFLTTLEGNGTVNGVPGQFESRRHKVFAPLPTIGVYGSYQIAPHVELGGNFDWLGLKVGDYDGRLVNAEAKLSYQVMKNVGIGVGYRYVDYRLDVKKTDWVGRLKYDFKGPTVFAVIGF
jgi:opacity protein-like surface antigen